MFIALAAVLLGSLSACSGDRAAEAAGFAQEAQAALNQGQLDSARQSIAKAMQFGGNQPDILLLDAQIKLQSGELRDAYDAFQSVLAVEPDRREALLAVGQIGLVVGETLEARKAYRQVLAADPHQPDALMISAVDAIDRERYAEALAIGEGMLARDPTDRRGLLLKARALSLLGQREEARRLLVETAEKTGNDELFATVLLENARDAGDSRTMLEQMAVLRQSRPNSADLALDEASIRYKTQDLAGGRAVSLEFLQNPAFGPAAINRLVTIWREYDPDPLSAQQLNALASSGSRNARVAVARYLLEQGQTQLARDLVADGADIRIFAVRVRADAALGQPGIIGQIANLLAQDRTNCDALAAAAEWNLAQGKPSEALKSAQVLAAGCPDIYNAYLLVAQSYLAANRPADADRAFRDGLTQQPDNRALAAAYINWLSAKGREGRAVGVGRRLARAAPSRPSSWALFETACRAANDPTCIAEAAAGRRAAASDFSLDLPAGERVRNPLLGRQWN